MIIVVTGWFDEYDRYGMKTGKKVFGVSHGIDGETGETVIMSFENDPKHIGAVWNDNIGEWVIYDTK